MKLVIRASSMPKRTPRPHQVKGISWCMARNLIALFWEMRTGKTMVMIRRFKSLQRVLVIGPLSVLDDWWDELQTENEGSRVVIAGSRRVRVDRLGWGRKWNLTNFEAINSTPEILSEPWDCVIVDESPRIKNPQAKISKRMVKGFRNVPHKALLSGEPAPEGPMDYVMQYLFLYGEFMGFKNYWAVRNRACFLAGRFNWIVKPQWKKKIKDYIQSTSYILSRKEAGLDNKTFYRTRYIEPVPKQKRIAKKIMKEFALTIKREEIFTKYVPVTWVWLAQLAGGFVNGELVFPSKMRELAGLLTGELKRQQVVVWFRFNQEIFAAMKALKQEGVSCAPYLGKKMKRSERRYNYHLFKAGKVRVLLCQIKVGLYSLNLSAASTAIYYSNGFSWEARRQSMLRVEHMDKKDSMLIIDLVTRDSMDEIVVSRLKNKRRVSQYYLRKEIYEEIIRRAA